MGLAGKTQQFIHGPDTLTALQGGVAPTGFQKRSNRLGRLGGLQRQVAQRLLDDGDAVSILQLPKEAQCVFQVDVGRLKVLVLVVKLAQFQQGAGQLRSGLAPGESLTGLLQQSDSLAPAAQVVASAGTLERGRAQGVEQL